MFCQKSRKKIRKAEFLNEMHFLGIEEYWMLDIEDGTLMQHINCLEHIDFSFYTKIFVTAFMIIIQTIQPLVLAYIRPCKSKE